MNRGSFHKRGFRRIHFSVFNLDTDKLKMALLARKVSGAFEKRVLGLWMQTRLKVTLAGLFKEALNGIGAFTVNG